LINYLRIADSPNERTFAVLINGMQMVEQDEAVTARFPEKALYLFDRNTGEARKSVDHIDSRVISSNDGKSDRTGCGASSKRW
jgi:hypothetical protein